MNIHEYQARDIFRGHGLPVPEGRVATTADEAVAHAAALGLPVMVKAQVLTGGRGKAGGVKFCPTEADVGSTPGRSSAWTSRGTRCAAS